MDDFKVKLMGLMNVPGHILEMTKVKDDFFALLKSHSTNGRGRISTAPSTSSRVFKGTRVLSKDSVLADLSVNAEDGGRQRRNTGKKRRLGAKEDDMSFASGCDSEADGRPRRAASRMASTKIRETTVNWRGKLRNDPAKVDEMGFIILGPPDSLSNKSQLSRTRTESDTFLQPRATRTRQGSPNPSSTTVKDKIATFEKLTQSHDLIKFSTGKSIMESENSQQSGANPSNHNNSHVEVASAPTEVAAGATQCTRTRPSGKDVSAGNRKLTISEDIVAEDVLEATLIAPRRSSTRRLETTLTQPRNSSTRQLETTVAASRKSSTKQSGVLAVLNQENTPIVVASDADKTVVIQCSPTGVIIAKSSALKSFSPVVSTSHIREGVVRESEDMFSTTFSDGRTAKSDKTQGTVDQTRNETLALSLACGGAKPKIAKKRKKNAFGNGTLINSTYVSTNGPDNESDVRTRTKTRRLIDSSLMEEFFDKGVRANLESTRCDPDAGEGTFVVNKSVDERIDSSDSVEIPETVVKAKRTKAKKRKSSNRLQGSFTAIDCALSCETFTLPSVPIPRAKRTKNVTNPLCFDGAGNPIIDEIRTARTRTVETACSYNVPCVDGGRPKRIRTKVRRFGDDDESSETDVATDSRSTRTRTRSAALVKQRSGNENMPFTTDTVSQKSGINRKRISGLKSGIKKVMYNGRRTSSSGSRFKTPLSPLTNKLNKKNILSAKKVEQTAKKAKIVIEEAIKSAEAKQKQDLAAQKREEEIEKKRKLMKMKTDEKLQRALICRQKLESEKQEQILQAEKEKELKRQQAIEERKERQKADLMRKKLVESKKLAELEERRRLEEEARHAKMREMELEQQKIAHLKLKEQEMEEKRAKERLEEKKKLKEAEKLVKLKLVKRAEGLKAKTGAPSTPISSKYKARNENDYGLEDENSEKSDEESPPTPKKPVPSWVHNLEANIRIMKYITPEMLSLFVPSAPKTPNIHKMFNMTPTRHVRRNSSAVWNTPEFTQF